MSLDATALVTEDEARSYLGVSSSDDPAAPLLEQIINGLSARITSKTGSTYINTAANDAATPRTFTYEGTGQLRIDNVRETSKVEVTSTPGDSTSWRDLAATSDYVLEPEDDDVKTQIRFLLQPPALLTGWGAIAASQRLQRGATPWPREAAYENVLTTSVRVTGKWGFGPDTTAVPADVKLALLIWLQNLHLRDQAYHSDNVARVMAGVAMPKDTEELLTGQGATDAMVRSV